MYIKLMSNNFFQTNVPFLLNVLEHPKFLSGPVDTHFIDENPHLFDLKASQNRAQKLLNYLGTVLVNGPQTPVVTTMQPSEITVEPPETPTGECSSLVHFYRRDLELLCLSNLMCWALVFSFKLED